jgi:hypothetical protein
VKLGRILAVVLGLALAIAACDRVVDLTPSPDAGHTGDSAGNDGFAPDGGHDGGSVSDAGGIVPDAFTGD